HTRFSRDWSSDVCSSDLTSPQYYAGVPANAQLEYLTYYRAYDYALNIKKQNIIEISFADAFRDISVKDFIKYIMMRYSLTLFVEIGRASCRERAELAAGA